MSEKTEKAKALFLGSYNCSQSTFSVFASELRLTFKQATDLTSGLGAGMCYQGRTCGAVAGAYLALGLVSGQYCDEPELIKENTFQLIREFNKEFQGKFGSTECKQLLGVDLSSQEGILEGKEKELFTKRCPLFVEQAVQFVEKALELKNKK